MVIDAPSNLGLRPPAPGTVPGCHKLAGAMRELGIVRRLGAYEGGVIVPGRYDRGDWQEGDGVFDAAAMGSAVRASSPTASNTTSAPGTSRARRGLFIQLGAALALRRIGRYGIAVIDGSADFRRPGNSDRIGAAGGEELALATGRGRRTSPTSKGCVRTYTTRTYASSGCGTTTRTGPSSPS